MTRRTVGDKLGEQRTAMGLMDHQLEKDFVTAVARRLKDTPNGVFLDALLEAGVTDEVMARVACELLGSDDDRVRLATLLYLTKVKGAYAPPPAMAQMSRRYEQLLEGTSESTEVVVAVPLPGTRDDQGQ